MGFKGWNGWTTRDKGYLFLLQIKRKWHKGTSFISVNWSKTNWKRTSAVWVGCHGRYHAPATMCISFSKGLRWMQSCCSTFPSWCSSIFSSITLRSSYKPWKKEQGRNKKAPKKISEALEYRRPGSNRHEFNLIGFWDRRVYLFRHFGNPFNERGCKNTKKTF